VGFSGGGDSIEYLLTLYLLVLADTYRGSQQMPVHSPGQQVFRREQ